jgi:hypothetical protein
MEFEEKRLRSGLPTPVGNSISYKCTICNEEIKSLPINADRCTCRNIWIDTDAGRISIKDYDNAFVVMPKYVFNQ